MASRSSGPPGGLAQACGPAQPPDGPYLWVSGAFTGPEQPEHERFDPFLQGYDGLFFVFGHSL